MSQKLQEWADRDKQVRRLAKAIRDTAEDRSAPAEVRRECRRAIRAVDRDDEQEVRRLRRTVLNNEAPVADRVEAIQDAAELLRELRGANDDIASMFGRGGGDGGGSGLAGLQRPMDG